MAYQVPWGTPERTRRLPPRRPRRSRLAVVAIAGATLLLLLAVHAAWRGIAAPGPVSQAHGASERSCEQCHTTGDGVKDQRCRRCHEPGGPGRLEHRAHVRAGQGRAVAGPREAPACSRCHREHLGRPAPLSPRDAGQCAGCHFRGLEAHPELARRVATGAAARPARPDFSHRRHLAELEKRGVPGASACLTCHAPAAASNDLAPVSFDRHCASCHARAGSLGALDPVAPEDVVTPRDIAEFQTLGGRIVKTVVRHRDPWVLESVARLRFQVDPAGALSERAALAARLSVLRRRLARVTPLAGLDLAGLEARRSALEAEIARLEARRSGGAGASLEASLAPVTAAARLAAASGDPAAAGEARELDARARALAADRAPAEALDPSQHDARRAELLVVLDQLAAATPELRLRAEDLRRRVLALRPGDTSEASVDRALAERRAELGRVDDELGLRRSGVVPPQASLLARERQALEDAQAEIAARLREIGEPPRDTAPARDPSASLQAIVVRCAPCHPSASARLGEPPVPRRVLERAAFVHGPHLAQASCASCHAGVELAEREGGRHLPGIARCRECHAQGRVVSSCQQCHRYHPGARP